VPLRPASETPETASTPLLAGAERACATVRYIAVFVGLAVGGSNLIPWFIHPSSIAEMWPGLTLMRVNTAFAITAAALSLALWPRDATGGWRVHVARSLGVLVASIGGLTALQDLAGVDIGIDRLLGPATFPGDRANIFTAHPGRMSLNAALSLLFLGTALASLNRAGRWKREDFHPAAAFALIAALPAAMALVGHLLRIGNLTGLLHSTNILLHTATALFVLAIGVLAAQPDRAPVRRILSSSPEGVLLRMLLPGSAALLIGLAWLISRGREAKIIAPGEGTAVMLYGGLLLLYLLLVAAGRAVQRQADSAQRASAALRAGEERSRSILDTALDGVVLMDAAGVVVDWNPAAERIFGWQRDEAIGKSLADLIIPEPLRAAHTRGLARYLESGTGPILRKRLELSALRREGSEFPVEVVINALHGADPVLFVGFIRDITERKAAEQSLRAAKEFAETASRAKDDFLAALSHELRNPLAPVLLSATALREDQRLPPDVRADLAMMERNISLEARIIDDLLDLTRIARGRLPMRAEHCDAHALLTYSEEIVRDEAATKRLNVKMDLRARYCGLAGDPARLQQLFWNLLRNAVKFTPPGGTITITTRNESDSIIVEVSDSGIGFEPGQAEKLFEPFAQGGLENDHRFGGLGLGLAIARAIVNMHHGSIRAHSAGPGQGARFTAELPDAMEPPQHAPRPASLPAGPEKSPASLHILVVEDHAATLATLTRLLKHAGHRVTTAANVAAGVAAAEAAEFDVVLSDLGLPDGTGIDLMRQLRARQPDLRGIALSGYGMEEDLLRSREAGFAFHLVKPVDFTQLRRALVDVMRE